MEMCCLFIRVVRLLVARGACVDNATYEVGTALARAAWKGLSVAVEYLLQEQVDPNLKTGPYGSAFLSAVASGKVAVVKGMLPSGADIHTPGNRTSTRNSDTLWMQCPDSSLA